MSTERTSDTTKHDRWHVSSKNARHGRRVAKRDFPLPNENRGAIPTRAQVETTVLEGPRADLVSLRFIFGARILGISLDDKLAEGNSPETSRLLATRARLIVTMAQRQALARNWLDVIACARAPYAPLSPSVPMVRNRVIEAQDQIESLADALMAPPPTVRGVAMASSLLSDGAGPIYNRACPVDLGSAIGEVIARLDPLNA